MDPLDGGPAHLDGGRHDVAVSRFTRMAYGNSSTDFVCCQRADPHRAEHRHNIDAARHPPHQEGRRDAIAWPAIGEQEEAIRKCLLDCLARALGQPAAGTKVVAVALKSLNVAWHLLCVTCRYIRPHNRSIGSRWGQ